MNPERLFLSLTTIPYSLNVQNLDSNPIPTFYHYHQGIEVLYIHEGQGTIITSGRIHSMKSGQLFLFPPYNMHKVMPNINSQHPYRRTILKFEPYHYESYLQAFPELLKLYHAFQSGTYGGQCLNLDEDGRTIISLFESLQYKESAASKIVRTESFAARLVFLLDLLRDKLASSQIHHAEATSRNHYPELVMEWIEDHLHEEFRLDALAKFLHLSKHHVSRVFRTETGSPIQQYLNSRRIRQACLLLHTTDCSVEHIAQQVGLSSFSYFCKLFKNCTGLSPLQYKKYVYRHEQL